MRILVTSARSPHALTAIREFGSRGWDVTATDCTSLGSGLYSRYVNKRIKWPNMTEQPERWIETCLDELKGGGYDLIFPTFEETFLVSRFRDELARYTNVIVESYEKMMRVHHKIKLTDLATSLGLDVPETWQPASPEELDGLKGDLPYPLVMKLPDANNSLGLCFCDDADSLVKAWNKLIKFYGLSGDRMPMIQRKIQGEIIFSLFLADRGRTVGQLIYEPLLMFPEGGGTAFYRQSARNEQAEELSFKLMADLEWHGFLGFDYIKDPDTGRSLLIDANPRPNPAFMTGQSAGVDFAGMVIEMVKGGKPKPMLEPKPGVRSKTWFVHWLWFSFQLMPGRNWWGRIRKAFKYFWIKGFVPDIHRSDDPKPSWIMALYVPYFMFVVNTLKPKTGGFMFGCNYDRFAAEKIQINTTRE